LELAGGVMGEDREDWDARDRLFRDFFASRDGETPTTLRTLASRARMYRMAAASGGGCYHAATRTPRT